ncbi:MAG: hypothetical protein M0R33_18885 [Methylomonas sp.]|jgi:hypothetical protein|uniref:hypothetical protein n=1 Tax=Methylomonas sp. TaxID=418 RepID=UPI0025E08DB9|nr:hypothetical protein [Methylomonas sp.]MCK9608511.1 hypothetical protein [Methylomonas sp.]
MALIQPLIKFTKTLSALAEERNWLLQNEQFALAAICFEVELFLSPKRALDSGMPFAITKICKITPMPSDTIYYKFVVLEKCWKEDKQEMSIETVGMTITPENFYIHVINFARREDMAHIRDPDWFRWFAKIGTRIVGILANGKNTITGLKIDNTSRRALLTCVENANPDIHATWKVEIAA